MLLSLMFRVCGIAAFLSCLTWQCLAQQKLRVVVQPDMAFGGTPFFQQPLVHAVDSNGDVDASVDGIALHVSLYETSPQFVKLRAQSGLLFTVFSSGVANFTDLYINEANSGYRLLFETDDAAVISEEFLVEVGPEAKIAIAREPGIANGGTPFQLQPVIELQDAGGNLIEDHDDDIMVSVALLDGPGEGELYSPTEEYDVPMINGTAVFTDLTIDFAGLGYVLEFSTDYPIPIAAVNTSAFTVGVGPTAALVLLQEPEGARGGIPFSQQPIVALVDAGGNINTADNRSWVRAEIANNPSLGTLSPQYLSRVIPVNVSINEGSVWMETTDDTSEHLRATSLIRIAAYPRPIMVRRVLPYDHITGVYRVRLDEPWFGPTYTDANLTREDLGLEVPVIEGIATFENLTLNYVGLNYTLRFISSLTPSDRRGHGYGYGHPEGGDSGEVISVESFPFHNLYGEPTGLEVYRPVGKVWAGGQPFARQPVVALVDGGRNVMREYINATITAEILDGTNSNDAELLGGLTVDVVRGLARFRDLQVTRRGSYTLKYTTNAGTFSVFEDIEVQFSSEWQVMPHDRYPLDRFGHSIALEQSDSPSRLVVGSPLDDHPIHEVQHIRTRANATQLRSEIQILYTKAERRNEVQRISICADEAGFRPVGEFTLTWGSFGPTRWIDCNTYPEHIKVVLEADMAVHNIGRVTVTEAEPTCIGEGVAFDVEFRHQVGFVDLLVLDEAQLRTVNASNAAGLAPSTDVAVVIPSTLLDGNFTLSIGNLTTPPLPYDVDPFDLGDTITAYLGTGYVGVSRGDFDAQRGNHWRITFPPLDYNYDVPTLEVDYTNLTGYGAWAGVVTEVEGEAPLGGTFQLSFRSNGPTPPIPYDATAEEMKAALHTLFTIDVVDVTREGPTEDNGYDWFVTFIRVRHRTGEGFIVDPLIQNLENIDVGPLLDATRPYEWRPIDSDHVGGMLTGTGATVIVKGIYSGLAGQDFAWDGLVRGSTGDEAGSVYVFDRDYMEWWETAKLVGSDTDDYDHFGWAVDVDGDVIAVGSPGAADQGVLEVQTMACQADGGTFTLTWEGHTTAALDFSITEAELQEALEALHTLHEVTVSVSSGSTSPVCTPGGETTLITFVYPQNGDQPMIVPDTELLSLGGGSGTLTVADDTVEGTRVYHGTKALDAATGAVYVFRKQGLLWEEEQKVMPVLSDRGLGDSFGYAVLVQNNTLLVSAPEDSSRESSGGAIYHFEHSGGTWTQIRKMANFWTGFQYRCGTVMALYHNSLLVTCPGDDEGRGSVLLFERNPGLETFHFHFLQRFVMPSSDHNVPGSVPEVTFGASLAIYGHTIAIGAPGARDGSGLSHSPGASTGAVYVYDRSEDWTDFELRQTLIPSVAISLDGVGRSVGLYGNVITVGASNRYDGPLTPRQEVQLIQSTANPGATISHVFRLGWYRWQMDNGEFELVMSSDIPHDVEEPELRAVLEEELLTGEVWVERFGPNQEDGYRWFVTFMEAASDRDLPLLTVESDLLGDGASIDVSRVSRSPPTQRSHVTVYTRDPADPIGPTAYWQEQGILRPYEEQPADLFGYTMMTGGNVVAVGSPNRDSFVSGQHSGAVLLYDLTFLNFRFVNRHYEVDENAGITTVQLEYCQPACHVTPAPAVSSLVDQEHRAYFITVDGDDWGVYEREGTQAPIPEEGDSYVRAPAYGRKDCYPISAGTTNCLWVYGDGSAHTKSAYDFNAVSDYAPVLWELVLDAADVSTNASVVLPLTITNDGILEMPDETFMFWLYSPGVQPTFGGNLWSTMTILDDGDGGIGAQSFFEKWASDDESPNANGRFGNAIAMSGHKAIISAFTEDVDEVESAGRVRIYAFEAGLWGEEAELLAPELQAEPHAHFGSSVDIDGDVAAVGCEGNISVAFFDFLNSSDEWVLAGTLQPNPPGETVRDHEGFAGPNALSIVRTSTDPADANAERFPAVAAVGARGTESVFIFRRDASTSWVWTQTAMLRSSDYRDFYWLGYQHRFRAHFGASVTLTRDEYVAGGVTLLVGSPFAEYGNYSEPTTFTEVERMDPYTQYFGKGAVYIYNYVPGAPEPQDDGTLPGGATYTSAYSWPEGDAALLSGSAPYVVPDDANGMWAEQLKLTAADGRASDRYGEVVAMDGHQIVIGSRANPGQPTTTWDFEQGNLRGWKKTGTAFDHQPTYGDNTAFRNVYSDHFGPAAPQSSRMNGRYWIGTYEKRPANPVDFTLEPNTPPGNVQGDEPQGTLTSEPFLIGGSTISLLVGGGCDERSVYVELLVDGDAVHRATGSCREEMRRIHWDVSLYLGRAAQIRIVDASSKGWAHINVDDIRFNWQMQVYEESPNAGAAYLYRRKAGDASEEPCLAPGLACLWQFQGKLQPSDKRRGAMFGFSVAVDDSTGTVLVGAVEHTQTWASWGDPGSTVGVKIGLGGKELSMSADGGINSGQTDYAGPYTVWVDGNPYLTNPRSSVGGFARVPVGDLDISLNSLAVGGSGLTGASGKAFSTSFGANPFHGNAAFDEGNPFDPHRLGPARGREGGGVVPVYTEAFGGKNPHRAWGPSPGTTGVVYVYRRVPEKRDGLWRLLSPPEWPIQQHSTLLLPSTAPGDRLGSSVAISGYTALVGAPGDSRLQPQAGAVASIDTEYQRIHFEKAEYVVTEDHRLKRAIVRVLRDGDTSEPLMLEWATRDITAIGVNATVAAECDLLPYANRSRAGCGDYTQKSGVVLFVPTFTAFDIEIDLENDHCWEPESEYFAIQLFLPGGVVPRGPGYSTVVRIDDDDADKGRETCLQTPLPDAVFPRPIHPLWWSKPYSDEVWEH